MPNLYYAQDRFCSDLHQHSFHISIWMPMLSFPVYMNISESKIWFCSLKLEEKSSSILSACRLLLFIVERKNERTVLEHPLCRTGTWCQYVSNKEDSRPSCKRNPGGIKRRALAALLRYCIANIIDSFCGLYCMDVVVTD